MADPASVTSGLTDESQGQHPTNAQSANSQLGSNTTSGNVPGAFDEEGGAPSLQRAPGGVGAVDPSGRKHHEATDENPGQFGIQGGAHLNSADNRPPQDYGTLQGGQAVQGGAFGAGPVKTDSLPPLESEQKRSDTPQGQDILGPGPAQSKLPPTEPTSERNSERGVAGVLAGGAAGAGSGAAAGHQHHQHHSQHDQPTHQTGGAATTGGEPTPATGATQDDPTQSSANQARRGSAGSDVGKSSLGDKIKGLVTEVKGHLKKDPELVEHGRAQHHGETASPTTGTAPGQ